MSKIILITGATDGIGRATAELLAQHGNEIIIHSRSGEKGERTADSISHSTGNEKISFVTADFTKLSEIKKMAGDILAGYEKIDVLINNAGVYRTTKNILQGGLEETFTVNYLAHFYLTQKLLPLIKKSEQGRIVNVSSMIHGSSIDFNNLQGEKHFDGDSAYSLSKLCNVLFTYKLAGKLAGTNITVNAVHPGVINTKLLIAGWGAIGENSTEAAKRLAFLAEDAGLKNVTGKYFMNNRQTRSSSVSYEKGVQDELWDISNELIGKLEKSV